MEPFMSAAILDPPFLSPSTLHLLGTDDVGHDVLREILIGTRISIVVGLIVGLTSALIGILVGAVAGFSEYADAPLMRIVDFLLVIPRLPLMICWFGYERTACLGDSG